MTSTSTSSSGKTTRQPRCASEADPTTTAPVRSRGRAWFIPFAAVIALLAALWAVIGSAWILPELSANSDEGVYLLQAETLRTASLAPEAPARDADAYLPWFSTVRDGRYVLKYAPIHASVLAATRTLTGSTRAGLGTIAGALVLLVIALTRELGGGRRSALVAGGLLATAPLVLQLDITYLPYGTSLALLLGTALAALRHQRTGSRAAGIATGLCWGLALFARPYDAIIFGLALVMGLVLLERRDGGDRRLGSLVRVAMLGATAPVVALLAYNLALTGDALRLPFRLLEPHDAPGLGLRRSLPSDGFLDYTPTRAASSLGRNLLLVTVWSAGGVLGCGLAVTTFARRRLRGGVVVLSVLVIWPIGYALFWGSYVAAYLWDGALFLGPFYYLPMVAILTIPAAVALDDLWRWQPPVAAVAGLAMMVLGAAVVVPRLSEQHERSQPRSAVADVLAATVEEPALVFVPPLYGPYLQNPLSFLRNTPDLDGPILYALDRGEVANDRVRAAHPALTAYRLVLPRGWNDQPGFEPDARVEELRAV